MTTILVLSDDGVATGFGRISMTINKALVRRGFRVLAASIQYDGLLPPQYEGEMLPYWVGALGGHNWLEETMKIASVYQPDIIHVMQDAPYGHHLRNAPLDWSRTAFMMTTPVDGTPIMPDWVETMKKADAALTISEFGVNAYRDAGVTARLCRPGIDPDVFYRMRDDERAALRAKLNIAPDAFVMGMMAQNQGRKAIPDTLRIFFEFAKGRPNARLLLDMDATSPAGWHIPALCQEFGWDVGKIIFKIDAQRAGLTHIRERYNLLDVHSVLAHREGYGLPLTEAMACGVVSMALDWCSGPEIVGSGRGLLVKAIPYGSIGTWGGALDKFPDIDHAVSEVRRIADAPEERALMAQRGMEWARAQTWTAAVDNVVAAIEAIVAKRGRHD